MHIDLNCDMGEGMGNDPLIMPFISSANIACGGHAGDDATIQQTIELALQHQVAIGAHPSFNDRENFGRTNMQLSSEQLFDTITRQLYRFNRIAISCGADMHHVKPHGALYNMAARDAAMSAVVVAAIQALKPGCILYGLSGSYLVAAAKKAGLPAAAEVFADRSYQDDGSLTPRSSAGALISEEALALQQVLQMVQQKKVTTIHQQIIPIQADTICIHGDGQHAVAFARLIHQTLQQQGIDIKTIS